MMIDIKPKINSRQELENLENILFFRGSIDYLLTEHLKDLENIHALKSTVRLLVNDCIESALQYVGTDRKDINTLNRLLR